MSRVSIRDFSFRYRKNQRPILSNINMDFSTDERILILGPSGGGKSTLLLAVLRLYTALDIHFAEGVIEYDGIPAGELSRRNFLELFGVVFQSPSQQFCMQYPEEEAAFGLENLQVESSAMQGLIDRSFRHFNFSKRGHSIHELSGGEQQILAAAATTSLGSKMLVMDEPTAHLDPPGRRSFRCSLESWLSVEKGFLLVEHHIDLWLDIIERVVILDDKGCILFDEKGTDILSREQELLSRMGIWLPRQSVFSSWRRTPVPDRLKDTSRKPPALEFRKACLGYDGKHILSDLDLQIKEGELVALAGKNGCGKSTLLQSLIGLSDLFNGSIFLHGEPYRSSGKKLKSRDVPAYLFQNPEHQFLYPTVREEVRSAFLSGNTDGEEQALLEKLRLQDKHYQNPFSLSGGEKRRLSLASLLGGDHSLYLLDEPTFGQDAGTADELMRMIEDLHDRNKTLVIVSHDLNVFRRVPDRIIILHEGKIAADGPPDTLNAYSFEQLEQWGVLMP